MCNQDALNGQCTNDLKEAKAFAKASEDALTRNKKGTLTPIDFSFSPAFFANTALDTAKPKPKSSATKPLWQYGRNTKQAFEDYTKALEQNDPIAWLELGKMYLQGVFVAPNPHKALEHFKKAAELGSEQAKVGQNLINENFEEEGIKMPSKPVAFSTDLVANGEGRAGLDFAFEECEVEFYEEIIDTLKKQAESGDAQASAWLGLYMINAGSLEESPYWYLEESYEHDDRLRLYSNRAYDAMQKAIKGGYIQAYYFLGGEELLYEDRSKILNENEALLGLYGFYDSMDSVCSSDQGNSCEDEYVEGLVPEDWRIWYEEEERTKFYNSKIKESLQKGLEFWDCLCAAAWVKIQQQEIERQSKEGKDIEPSALLAKRCEWIALLKPFWQEQRHHRVLSKLLELLEAQIAFCEESKGFDSSLKQKDIVKADLETFGYYKQCLKERKDYHKLLGGQESAQQLSQYYKNYNKCLLF